MAPELKKAVTAKKETDWKRIFSLCLGLALFSVVYFSPPWPDAVDPAGQVFKLSREGKGALAIFLLAGTWWVLEVVPIGVTSLMAGLLQALFLIRPAREAFSDFMTPPVMFIFASIMIGQVFTKTGLTKRLAYKMLMIVGEKTSMIYLGSFVITALLAHIMAHTAVAATLFPLLMAIYHQYTTDQTPTRFGKGLFMGMAYVAGSGSIVTLLGAARGAVALGFYQDIVGRGIGFFELTWYMLPVGWIMVFLLWGYFMLFFRPEVQRVKGLKKRARQLNAKLGEMSRNEILAGVIVAAMILALSLRSIIPALATVDKTAVILISSVLFFVFGILDLADLEEMPWNIILLFGGAMSVGFCLWQTGAANWLAVHWLRMFENAGWFTFIMSIAFFVMIMTNFIMNVAAIAISLPVALVIAPYLGVAPEVILFVSLTVAGMPFLLLVGAAPNAIAYNAGQFTSGEFFIYGIPASVLLLIVTGLAVYFIWPAMGMPILLTSGV